MAVGLFLNLPITEPKYLKPNLSTKHGRDRLLARLLLGIEEFHSAVIVLHWTVAAVRAQQHHEVFWVVAHDWIDCCAVRMTVGCGMSSEYQDLNFVSAINKAVPHVTHKIECAYVSGIHSWRH